MRIKAAMKNDPDKSLREQLVQLLNGGHAHATFDDAVEGFPPALRGKKTNELPYSPWMLLEHMRIAQWDILEFSRDPKHKSPEFPKGYWPKESEPPSSSSWEQSVKSFRADLKSMQTLVGNPNAQLHEPFSWGDGQTLFREALLLADHNAYHLGEFVVLRRLLGAWKK
jgi:hypothetical protein